MPGPSTSARDDAAICTFDSLSYILNPEDLQRVFSNVHAALRPGGVMVFDLLKRHTRLNGSEAVLLSRMMRHGCPRLLR